MQEHTAAPAVASAHCAGGLQRRRLPAPIAFDVACNMLQTDPSRMYTYFSACFVPVHTKLAENALYAIIGQYQVFMLVFWLWNRFGRGSQKSDQISDRLYSHAH